MRTPPQVTRGQECSTAVDSAAVVSPHMEVYWDGISMGENELIHEMYPIFEKYKWNYNDKACGSGTFEILDTYNKSPRIPDKLKAKGLLYSIRTDFCNQKIVKAWDRAPHLIIIVATLLKYLNSQPLAFCQTKVWSLIKKMWDLKTWKSNTSYSVTLWSYRSRLTHLSNGLNSSFV